MTKSHSINYLFLDVWHRCDACFGASAEMCAAVKTSFLVVGGGGVKNEISIFRSFTSHIAKHFNKLYFAYENVNTLKPQFMHVILMHFLIYAPFFMTCIN